MLDLLIRGGMVVDGTGAAAFSADVGVEGGKIAAIGGLAHAEAREALNSPGLVVAPGFIDIHSHSDFTLLVDPRAQSSIAQGVTTEVIGNCGHGCAPLADPELAKGNIYGYMPLVELNWRTMAEYLEMVETLRPAVNVVPLVPNGNLRLAAMGGTPRPATPTEVRQMRRLLSQSLDEGAFGLSTGLEYPAERGCTEEEIVALCRVVGQAGGLYATHARNRDTLALEAIREAIGVAQRAHVPLQISHIIPRKGGPPDAVERALTLVDDARARGVDVTFDSHTRLYGLTNLSAALPPRAFQGGREGLAARLRDPLARAKMKSHESIVSSFGLAGWDRVSLLHSPRCPDRVGRSFQELTPPGGDAYDAIFDVLLAEVDDPHRPLVICRSYDERQLQLTFQHPLCMVGSDATALAVDGPLADTIFLGAFTWAAWFFRVLVRETSLITLEAAIRKLTAMPAERLGLPGRGIIREGAPADLVVFDPTCFQDRGTLEEPNQLAEGVRHVVVNGQVAFRHGNFTETRGGKVLRRNS